jgi:CBS domain-containing protein
MPLIYTIARIFTSEAARFNGKPLYLEIVNLVREQKISARCQVTKGVAGCYENGEIATHGIEVLSFNMPLEILVIMPEPESAALLPQLEAMVDEGLMTVEQQAVHWHKCRKRMIPRQVKVKDVMTRQPRTLPLDAPASEALGILLAAHFHGIPILDGQGRPAGILTHADLLRHTELPIKVGLLNGFGPERLGTLRQSLAGTPVAKLMGKPAVVVQEDDLLTKAVDVMLMKDLKRLPVVAADGTLTGILSRLDVFKTIMDQAPDWQSFDAHGIQLEGVTLARDAMRRDTPTLPPSAPVWEAIKRIETTSVRRVAVVDPEGKLLGLISDKVLMAAFAEHKGGLLDLLVNGLSLLALARKHSGILRVLRARTVGEIMLTSIVSVQETDTIDVALQRMVAKGLKRIPVLDGQGRFQGMLTRDGLLRAGITD